MQKPEKSCSQCRARKTKCDMSLPRCGGCLTRNLHCQFGSRQKPGPPKGFKKPNRLKNDSHRRYERQSPGEASTGKTPTAQSTVGDEIPVTPVEERMNGPRYMADGNAMEADDAFDVQMLEDELVEAYTAMKHFPYLPHVRKEQLQDPEIHHTLRTALINALCAISANCASNATFEHLSMTRRQAAEKYAVFARSAYLRYTREEDHPTCLNVIKVAAILAVYQMYCAPGMKAWAMVGEAVRLSYDMRLDQLDSKGHLTSVFMPAEEAEDARYVWWSVYALDVYASSTLMRPFAITSTEINTALISTSEDQFKMGKTNPSSGSFLPSDPVELQMTALALDQSDPVSTQITYLLLLSLGRLIADMRREYLDGMKEDTRTNLIQNALATLRFSISDNFLRLHRGCNDMCPRLNVIEIMLLLELQSLCLYSFPSAPSRDLSLDSSSTDRVLDRLGQAQMHGSFDTSLTMSSFNNEWVMCVQNAFAIVKIVRELSSQDFSQISPTMATIFWLPAMTLVLDHRSRTTSAEGADAASGAELLKAALKTMGNTWTIAKNFHDALAALRAGPEAPLSAFHMISILQSYTSPLISVSGGQNCVNIPSFAMPYHEQSEDRWQWFWTGDN